MWLFNDTLILSRIYLKYINVMKCNIAVVKVDKGYRLLNYDYNSHDKIPVISSMLLDNTVFSCNNIQKRIFFAYVMKGNL